MILSRRILASALMALTLVGCGLPQSEQQTTEPLITVPISHPLPPIQFTPCFTAPRALNDQKYFDSFHSSLIGWWGNVSDPPWDMPAFRNWLWPSTAVRDRNKVIVDFYAFDSGQYAYYGVHIIDDPKTGKPSQAVVDWWYVAPSGSDYNALLHIPGACTLDPHKFHPVEQASVTKLPTPSSDSCPAGGTTPVQGGMGGGTTHRPVVTTTPGSSDARVVATNCIGAACGIFWPPAPAYPEPDCQSCTPFDMLGSALWVQTNYCL